MKKTFITATIVASLLAVFAWTELGAQQRPVAPQAAAPSMAVVDIGYIFKNLIRFKQMMDGMKTDVLAAEEALKKERDLIAKLMEQAKGIKPGTPDYKKLEEDITQRQSDFNVRAQLQKKEFMERESKLYYKLYQEVNDEVKYYADRNGIMLVMRFNGDPVDVNDRNSILAGINNQIVYQRGIDITPIILEELNRRALGAGGAPGVPQGPAGTGVRRPTPTTNFK